MDEDSLSLSIPVYWVPASNIIEEIAESDSPGRLMRAIQGRAADGHGELGSGLDGPSWMMLLGFYEEVTSVDYLGDSFRSDFDLSEVSEDAMDYFYNHHTVAILWTPIYFNDFAVVPSSCCPEIFSSSLANLSLIVYGPGHNPLEATNRSSVCPLCGRDCILIDRLAPYGLVCSICSQQNMMSLVGAASSGMPGAPPPPMIELDANFLRTVIVPRPILHTPTP